MLLSFRKLETSFVLVVLLLCFGWTGVSSADEPLRIQGYRSSFSPYIRRGAWVSQTVRVANDNDQSRKVKVGCQTSTAGIGRQYFTRIVNIPSHASRRIRIAYRPGTLPPPKKQPRKKNRRSKKKKAKPKAPTVRKKKETLRQDYLLWDAETGDEIQATNGIGSIIEPKQTAIALIGALEHDNTTYLRQMVDRPLGDVLFLGGIAANLPDLWYEYSMVDILVLGQVDVSALRVTQVSAILQWVRRGGVVVFTGSESMGKLLRGRLGTAAGVCVTGYGFVDSLRVTGPFAPSKPVGLLRPVPMGWLCPTTAEVVYRANGLPLLTRRCLGDGLIFTLATSVGGLKPKPLQAVWNTIGQARRTMMPLNPNAFVKAGTGTLGSIAGRRGPDSTMPVTIFVVLFAAVVVFGVLLARRRRGELLWLVLVPASILISIGLYVVSRANDNPPRLSHIGMITDMGGGEARVQQLFSYYSGPEDQPITFVAGSRDAVIRDIGQASAAEFALSEIRTIDAGMVLPDQPIRPDATRGFYVDSVEKIGRLGATVTFDEKGIFGTVDNRLAGDINDAVLYVNARAYRVGNLPAGGQTAIEVDDSRLLGKDEFTPLVVQDTRRNDLMRQLVSRPSMMDTVANRWLLIGYTPISVIAPLQGRELVRQGWSVIAWPVELVAPKPGTKVQIPAGFVDMEIKSTLWNVAKQEFIDSSYPNKLLILVRPPWPGGRLSAATAKLSVQLQAGGFKMVVSGVKLAEKDGNKKGRSKIASRMEMKTVENPAGRYEITIPRVERFRGADGRCAILLEVKRLAPATGGDATVMTWKIESMNVSLKGTVR
ncbi:MAG: hypothetical protein K8S55_16110 [Phycisphaerae bacterium]|nr:hypothetical protein [Phycisphaerae bacterium]